MPALLSRPGARDHQPIEASNRQFPVAARDAARSLPIAAGGLRAGRVVRFGDRGNSESHPCCRKSCGGLTAARAGRWPTNRRSCAGRDYRSHPNPKQANLAGRELAVIATTHSSKRSWGVSAHCHRAAKSMRAQRHRRREQRFGVWGLGFGNRDLKLGFCARPSAPSGRGESPVSAWSGPCN